MTASLIVVAIVFFVVVFSFGYVSEKIKKTTDSKFSYNKVVDEDGNVVEEVVDERD